jgi:hypothetical protein
MAVLPATPIVKINLTTGASFGTVMILGTGKLGQAILGTVKPNIVDVSASVLKISTRKERNLLQDKYLSGSATVRIVDPTGNWNPQNTSSIYYPNLQPLKQIQITANYSGTIYPIGVYYITEYKYTYPKNEDIGYVDLICYDAYRLFFNSNVTTVSGWTAGVDTGTVVNKILDTIKWPNSQRSIQTGNTVCVADPATTRSALDACHTAEFSEQGAFYIDRSGNAVFKNRQYVYDAQSKTPTKFSNVAGSTDINYFNIQFAFDDKTIVNSCTVTRIGGTAQTYVDTASKDQFFLHSVTAPDMIMSTDANALALSTAYVTTRKDTTIRIDAITLDLVTLAYTAGVQAALALDYFNTMQITNEGQGTSTIVKTLQCQGIAHDITANSWKTTFTTQEPLLDVMY